MARKWRALVQSPNTGMAAAASGAGAGAGAAAGARPRPRVRVRAARFVAAWKWDIADDDVCGICHGEFEKACAACKLPGEDCPPVWGACNHTFHMHCIMRWLEAQKDREPACPLCRRPWEFRSDDA